MPRTDRRGAILDAATRIIARDGIDAIRSATVAAEAGVSLALPHYYFPTLEDLVHASFAHGQQTVEIADDLPPADRLRALLVHDFSGDESTIDRVWALRTEFHRHAAFDAATRAEVAAAEARWIAAITDAVRALQASGEVSASADAARLAERLASLVVGLGVYRLIDLVTTAVALERIDAVLSARARWTSAPEGRAPIRVDPLPAADVDRRTAVLEATIRVIAENGVSGVHFPEVAAEAGVSTSLPRYYFPTIRELIRAAFAFDAEVSRRRVDHRADSINDPIDRLRDAYADQIAVEPAAQRATWTLWAEYLRLATHDAGERAQAHDRLARWIAYDRATIEEAQAAGRVPASVDAFTTALDLSAILNGAGALWLAGVLDVPTLVAVTDGAIDDALA